MTKRYLDPVRLCYKKGRRETKLTAMEFRILYLVRNLDYGGHIDLMADALSITTESLQVHICNLNKKLKAVGEKPLAYDDFSYVLAGQVDLVTADQYLD